MQNTRVRRGARIFGLALAALAIAAPAAGAAGKDRGGHHHPKSVDLQLLGINDFHGHLEPPSGSSGLAEGMPAGGAEYLATHVRAHEAGVRNSLVVAAGDLIGASPLISALFHDEPTIEAMNKIGLDIASVGNHEFDEGEQELRRMQEGGCHPVDGCQTGHTFQGADFGFLAANVVNKDTGKPMFPAYAIRKFQGVNVGFIGMTLEGTPLIVTPAGIQNLRFLDEADTANRYARELRRKGVNTIVVLLHEGGQQNPLSSPVDQCIGFTGPIVDIVNRTTDKVDLFMTGHTHQPYNCEIDGRPVTSAFSFGRVLTDVDMKLNGRSGKVRQIAVDNRIVTRDVAKAPDLTSLVDDYRTRSAPIANRVIGHTTEAIVRATAPDGESPAGNLIADSQLAATDDASTGNAVAAFMNIGGVRSDFPAGDVTYGAAFAVQPFGNNLTTITLTGAQVWTLLQQQWCNQTAARVLQPSATVSYTYDTAVAASLVTNPPTPCGATNPVTSLSIGGQAVPNDGSQSYRITVNSFLADGGDGFAVLPQGTDRLGGPVDLDALAAYLAVNDPVSPPPLNRINP